MKKLLDSKMLMFIFIICLFVLAIPNKVFAVKKTTIKAYNVSLSYTTTTYSGGYKEPTVNVSKKLTEGIDYTVSYRNNISAGTAIVTITGIGNYRGTINNLE